MKHKNYWLKIIGAGFSLLAIVGILAFPLHSDAVSIAKSPSNTTSGQARIIKSAPRVSLPKSLGMNATSPGSLSNQTSARTVRVANPGSVITVDFDTPVGPPPPIICHIYDACGANLADQEQGIYGTATIGPTTPVCRIDSPCDGPYQGTIIVSNSESEVTSFTPDSDGHFSVSLLPGTYKFTPAGGGRLPWIPPQTVTVYAGLYTQVSIQLDSGIR